MYQALLTRRYLTSKVMPLLAAVAVTLCTAMVLITWSVMGGFLDMLVSSGRTLIGDVSIEWPNIGFRHYEDLVEMLEADEMVAGAAPVIDTFGVLTFSDDKTLTVKVRGIDPATFSKVTTYEETLWWRPIEKPMRGDDLGEDPRLGMHDMFDEIYEAGLTLTEPNAETGEDEPALVVGIELSGRSWRQPGGWYLPIGAREKGPDGQTRVDFSFFPLTHVTLNVLPLDSKGHNIDFEARRFPVANEFQTGFYEADASVVLVRLDALQDMLKMDPAKRVIEDAGPFGNLELDESGEPVMGAQPETTIEPGRVTTVLVRAIDGVDAETLKARCKTVYEAFAQAHDGDVPHPERIGIDTWEDANRTLIAAVKKETALVLFIFCFISLTAVFLVLAIFWSMVSEKTRDVGVLRSIGASRFGVASVWLAYGAGIGVVGSILGGSLAYAIVLNINPIHDWLGETLELTIWDPSIYYFTEIPNEVNTVHAAIVLVGGVLASVLGALIPAWRAAAMDPVRALRFE